MTFVSGNNFGGFKPGANRFISQRLISELNTQCVDPEDQKRRVRKVVRVVRAMVREAMDGNMVAVKEIFDRVEGKVPMGMALALKDDTQGFRINPADATEEEMEILMAIAQRRKAPMIEAQLTSAVEAQVTADEEPEAE